MYSLLHLVGRCSSEEELYKLSSCWSQREVSNSEMLPKMFDFMLFTLLGIYFRPWNYALIFHLKPFHRCTGPNARRIEYDHEVSLPAYPTRLNFRNLCNKLQKWLVINLCTQKSRQTKPLMPHFSLLFAW